MEAVRTYTSATVLVAVVNVKVRRRYVLVGATCNGDLSTGGGRTGWKKNRRSRHETTNKNRKNNLLENATVDTKIKNKTGIHITRHVRRTVIGP
jgi:hypothetical protein